MQIVDKQGDIKAMSSFEVAINVFGEIKNKVAAHSEDMFQYN